VLCINCSAFSQRHLGQIHTVYPTAYQFKQEKDLPMFGGKTSGYQLTVEAILDAASDDDGMIYFVLSPVCAVFQCNYVPIVKCVLYCWKGLWRANIIEGS